MDELGIPVKVTFAQNREDIFLDYFFKDATEGFYVDVGANDPLADSVTKLFYDKGWHGINIEPIKRLHQALERQRPNDINLNIGIGARPDTLVFREYTAYHGLSTMVDVMQQNYRDKTKQDKHYGEFIDYKVPVRTLDEIFTENKVTSIQFMKVDVEGFEYEVLAGNDWKKYRPEVICIEANHIINDWRPMLTKANYNKVYNDGLNDYYVAYEAKKRGELFSYEQAVLPVSIVPYAVANAINTVVSTSRSEKNALIFRNSQLTTRADALNHQLVVAETELARLRGIKGLAKALLGHTSRRIEQMIYPLSMREQLQPLVTNILIPNADNVIEQIERINQYDQAYLTKRSFASHPVRSRSLAAYRLLARASQITLFKSYGLILKLRKLVRGKM